MFIANSFSFFFYFSFFLTFLAVKSIFIHPVSLVFLVSTLLSKRMLLTPLNSWCLISIGDTGSSEWYANTTFAEPTCNESNLLIENHDHQHFYTSLYQEFGLFSTTEFRAKLRSCLVMSTRLAPGVLGYLQFTWEKPEISVGK